MVCLWYRIKLPLTVYNLNYVYPTHRTITVTTMTFRTVLSALASTIVITLFCVMAWYGFHITVGEKHDGVYIDIKTTGVKGYFFQN